MSFILLGHHRSGSSFLLDAIRHHPEVDTINEPFSMHLEFFRSDETAWGEDDYNQSELHPSLSDYPQTVNFIKDLDKWLNNQFPNMRGFKETALFEKYWWLKKAISFDKLLFVIRDPRAVIASVISRDMHLSWWDYKGRLENYYPEILSNICIQESPVKVCAAIWKCRMEHIINIMEKEDNHILIRLEDVLNNPNEEIDRIMRYLGYTIHEKQKSFLRETSGETRNSTYSNYRKKEIVLDSWKKKITKEDIGWLEDYLSEELKYFRYII